MNISRRAWLIAIGLALYLYFLLPATATLFYELYHLTGVDAVYWGYGGFKAAGYYLGVADGRVLICLAAGAAVLGISAVKSLVRAR
ncbi:MAG: hypothetical protein AB8C02_02140 [Halioglobus sp.]